MSKTRHPKLLDLVAVLNRSADSEVEVGDVGTVVELLPPDGLEVEFLDQNGTRAV
jgi:catabolite regulation protein CreA